MPVVEPLTPKLGGRRGLIQSGSNRCTAAHPTQRRYVPARRSESSATRRSESGAKIGTVQRQPGLGRAGGVVNEIEKRFESGPNGSSELCEGTAVVGT